MSELATQDPTAAFTAAKPDVQAVSAARALICSDSDARRAVETFIADLPSRVEAAAGDADLARRKGLALWAVGRERDSVDWLAHAAGDAALLCRARALIGLGRPSEALEALGDEGKSTEAALTRASAHCALGDADAAAENLGSAEDASAEFDYLTGRVADLNGERADARAAYERAIEKDAEHALALFRLAYMESAYGSADRAFELYRRCIDTSCPPANAYLNLGNLHEDRAEFAKARDCYAAVLKADPQNERARLFHEDANSSLDMFYDEDMERRSDRRSAVLRLPVTDFELSVRSRNCLAKMGVHTLGDLIQRTEAELLSYKNFGETSLQEIKDILAQKGLRLGMAREDVANEDRARTILEGMGAPSNADVQANLRKPLSELELSVRSRHCMNVLNLKTVGDLVDRSEAELMTIKNFGQTSLNEVKQKLAELGLTLSSGK